MIGTKRGSVSGSPRRRKRVCWRLSCGEIHRSAIPAVIGIGMTVLIAGCGYLGSRVATQLIAAGHRVIGLTRSSDAAPRLREIGIEPATGDLSNEGFCQVARTGGRCRPLRRLGARRRD